MDAPRTDAGTGSRNQPPRIKTREAVSREPSPVSDRQPSRADVQNRARPMQIKTREAVRENRWVHRKDADKIGSYPMDKPAEQGSSRIFRNKSSEIKTPRRSPADEPVVHPSDGAATPAEHLPRPPDIKARNAYVRRQRLGSEQPPTEPVFRQGKQEFIQAQGRKSAVKRSENRRQNLTDSEACSPAENGQFDHYVPLSAEWRRQLPPQSSYRQAGSSPHGESR